MSDTQEKTASFLAQHCAAQIKGKVILTTGVSPSTLAAVFVRAIAKSQPALLILAGRNMEKVQETAKALEAENVKVRTLELNLGSIKDVRVAAATVNGWADVPYIDVLVNNAGVMAIDYGVSPEGNENHLAINHLGPFLFTNLIMAKVLASASPRVVTVSSDGHRLCPIRFDDVDFRKGETYNRWQAYGQSKTANMLMALSLADKLGTKGKLQAFSLTPGPWPVPSHLGDHIDWSVQLEEMLKVDRFFGNWQGWLKEFPMSTPDEGVAVYVVTAFDQNISAHNGTYFYDCRPANPGTETLKPWATSSVEAERLWKLTENLVGQEFQY
ncbi:retinol dehydrogenase 13 [Metarhizium guizhouense ARSEF 977]|uniref:Retinol dehydrogenase 13 n=1 Tax=Metarhizium guizhouense (strain ARSEF 977) TaxID=1276136 RepID=A0A0B4G5R5_METGA|nr:retinol dehydrogenase 13 [Metarhizium guizhouense ARSEF 977]